jgi:hypothetical protein
MFKACLEMHNIAAKNHRSSLREPHEQRLVAGRVSGGGEQYETSIAEARAEEVIEESILGMGMGH